MNPLIWSLQFQLLIFSWWTSAMNTGTSSNAALFLYWRPCSWSYAWRSSQKTLRPWVWKVKQTSLTWRWSFRNELGDGWRIGFDWWFGQISWHRFFWSKSKLLNPLCFVFCFQKKHIFVLRWVVCIRIYIYTYLHPSRWIPLALFRRWEDSDLEKLGLPLVPRRKLLEAKRVRQGTHRLECVDAVESGVVDAKHFGLG